METEEPSLDRVKLLLDLICVLGLIFISDLSTLSLRNLGEGEVVERMNCRRPKTGLWGTPWVKGAEGGFECG